MHRERLRTAEGQRAARWGGVFAAVLTTGFLCLVLGRLTVNEVVLDLRHRVAVGTVTKVELRRSVDFARVSFEDQRGRQHSAQVQQSWWPSEVEVGDTQRIDYDPSHPTRARRHGAHDPLALWPLAAALLLAIVLGRSNRSRRRDRRTPRPVVLNPQD